MTQNVNKTNSSEVMHNLRLAGNDTERVLAKAGIPRRFWHLSISQINFIPTPFYGASLSTIAQRHWVNYLVKSTKWNRHRVVVIGSSPTDEGAIALASYILERAARRNCPVMFDDVAHNERTWYDPYPYFFALQNVTKNITRERSILVRDAMRRFYSATTIICVAGITDPYKFACNHLNVYPDAALRVMDIVTPP